MGNIKFHASHLRVEAPESIWVQVIYTYAISLLVMLSVALVYARPNWQDLPAVRLLRRARLVGGWGELFAEARDLLLWVTGILVFASISSALIRYAGIPTANFAYSALRAGRTASAGPITYIATCLATSIAIAHGTRELWHKVGSHPPRSVVDPESETEPCEVDLRLGLRHLAGYGLTRRFVYFAPVLLLRTYHQLRKRDNVFSEACLYLLLEQFGEALVLRFFDEERRLNSRRQRPQRRKFVGDVESVMGLSSAHVAAAKSSASAFDSDSAWLILEAMYLELGYRGTAAHLLAYSDNIRRRIPRTNRIELSPPFKVGVACQDFEVSGEAIDVCVDGSGLGIKLPLDDDGQSKFSKGHTVHVDVSDSRIEGHVVYYRRHQNCARIGLTLLRTGTDLLSVFGESAKN